MRKLTIFLTGLISLTGALWGNPQNPTVVSGTASFDSTDPLFLDITASDLAIISWDSFSITDVETTRFVLPSETATVLNRVTMNNPSRIAGLLQSNGQVYLINENGIVVTPSGVVNTAAFIGATLDVSDSEFLMGGDLNFSGMSTAGILNNGQIVAWNGDVYLLSYSIQNYQEVTASNGTVAFGAGQQILVTPMESQKISVQLTLADVPDGIGIEHEGVINSLQAELKANGGIYALAIQCDGVVNATSTVTHQGRIYLVAPNGLASVSGKLDATGFNVAGGEIQVLGNTVALTEPARLDVSGGAGGGTILVGGSFQGSDPTILNSIATYVDNNVRLYANATGLTGNGGEIVVWSDGSTYFYGINKAEAAPFSGNGGQVEVSGHDYLEYMGMTSTFAPNGMQGMLLLDPSNFTISTGADSNIMFGGGCGANTYCGTATTSVLNITTLLTQLGSTPVTIDSNAGAGAGAGTVTLANALTVPPGSNNLIINSRSTFTMNTGATIINNGSNSITINSGFSTVAGSMTIGANITNNSATGNINLNGGSTSNGSITFAATATSLSNTSSGNINITTGSAASTGTISTNALTVVSNSGSGTIAFSSKDAATSMAINGPVQATSTGPITFSTSQGNTSFAATATVTSNAGAPITITNSAGTTTLAGAFTLSGGAGPLTITSLTNVTLTGTINNGFTGTTAITAQTGTMNVSATITNSNTGTLNLSSGTTGTGSAISFNAGAGLTNSSSGNVNITAGSGAFTGAITSSATSTLNNSGTGNIILIAQTNTGTAIGLAGPMTGVSPGTFSMTTNSGNISNAGTMNFSGGGPVTVSATLGNVSMTGTTLSFTGGVGPLTVSANNAGSTLTFGVAGGSITVGVTGTSNISCGQNMGLNANFTNNNTGTVNFSSGVASNGNLTFGTGINLTNSANGAINMTAGGGAFTGTITTSTTSTLTNSGVSGTMSFIAQGATTGLNIQGPITASSSGTFLLRTIAGAITSAATTTMNFTGGAPVTIESITSGTTVTLAGSSMSFSGGAGPLTVTARTALAINGPITYSYTGPLQFTSTTSTITTAAAASMTFNSGSGNVTFSAPQSNITTNAGATLTFNAGAGNLTMTAGTAAMFAGTLTNNSSIVFSSGAGKTITMTSNGALAVGNITNNSTGNTTLTTTAAGISTNAGTTLQWNNPSGNLIMNATTSITTSGNILFNAGAGTSSPDLSMTAGTAIAINGTATNNSSFDWLIQNTLGTISTGAGGTITFGPGSGKLTINATNTAGLTAVNIQAPIIYHSTGPFSITANTGNITSTSAATLNFDMGAQVTIQSLGAASTITLAGSTMNFSGGVGPVLLSSVGNMSVNGAITDSDTGTFQFISTQGSITGNASASMTFNSGSGDVSFSTPRGTITTNASATITFNMGAGNLTMTSGTPAMFAGNIANSSSIIFDSGVGKAITMTANGTLAVGNITYNSTGNATLTTTGGALSTNAATTLNWGPSTSAGNLSMVSSSTILISGNIIFSAAAGTSPTALSMIATTNTSINGNVTYSSPFNWVVQDSGVNGTFTTSSISNILFNAGAGSMLVTYTNAPAANTINLQGPITNHGTNLFQFLAPSGHITSSASNVLLFDNGAPATFQTMGVGSDITLAGSTMTFSGGAGPLQVLSSDAITISGALFYSDSMPAILTAGGAVTISGSSSISGTGGLTVTAAGTLLISGSMAYTATGQLTLTSTASAVQVTAPINMATTAPLVVSAGTNFNIFSTIRNSSSGTMSATTGQDMVLGTEETVVNVQIGSAGGDLTFTVGRDLILHTYNDDQTPGYTQVGYHTGDITSNIHFTTVGRDITLYGGWIADGYTVIGHGSMQPGATGGTRTGNITFDTIGRNVYLATYQMSANLPTNSNSFVQIGHLRSLTGTPVTATGNIDMSSIAGNVTLIGTNAVGSYALIGHGGSSSTQTDSFSGNVVVHSNGGPIVIQGGSFAEAFAGIGHAVFMSGPGVVTLQADLVEAVSSSSIELNTGSGAEAFIGLYVKATAAGGSGAISAVTPMTLPTINVQTSGAGDLTMEGAVGSNSFNGVMIGILAYTGVVPFAAAGDVGGVVDLTVAGDLILQTGFNGASTNAFAAVINGIGNPPAAAYDVAITAGGIVDVLAGNQLATLTSLDTLSLTAGDRMTMTSTDLGSSTIMGSGAMTISVGPLDMSGTSPSRVTTIQSTLGNLMLTASDTHLTTNSLISAFNALTMTVDDLLVANTSGIHGGTFSIMSTGNTTLAAGGSVFIDASLTGSLSVTGNILIFADAGGSAEITAGGDLAVASTGKSIYMIAFPNEDASINSTAGTLSVTASQGISLLNGAEIQLLSGTGNASVTATSGVLLLDSGSTIRSDASGSLTITGHDVMILEDSTVILTGAGLLTANTTVGDMTIHNGGLIQNFGSGGLSSTVAGILAIQGGPDSEANMFAGSGGATVSANAMVMNGYSASTQASVSALSGQMTVSTTLSLSLDRNGRIALLGGSGNYQVTAGNDLYIGPTSILQNVGTGTTSASSSGYTTLAGSTMQGNTGALTLSGANGVSLINGALVSTKNAATLSSMSGNIFFSASTAQTTANNMTLTATTGDIVLQLGSVAKITAGTGIFSANAAAGNLDLINGSSLQNNGSGDMNGTVGGNLVIKAGAIGDSIISGKTTLSLSVGGILNVQSFSSSKGAITSSGTTSITAGELSMVGTSTTFPALIQDGTGTLSVSAGIVSLNDFAMIKTLAGVGTLSVNSTNGDLRIANGSLVQHLGTGAISSSVSRSLFIEGGPLGAASLLSGNGGMTVSADQVVMTGFTSIFNALITAAQGTFSLTTTRSLILDDHAKIALTSSSGSGVMQVMVGGDLLVANDSIVQNAGSGATMINVGGGIDLFAGAGNAIVQTASGALSFGANENIYLASDINGSAMITCTGSSSVTTLKDLILIGSPGSINTSTIKSASGALTVSVNGDITVAERASISIASGNATLTLNALGDVNIENNSFIAQSGTGAISSMIGGNMMIRSGLTGSSSLSANSGLTLSLMGDLNVESAAGFTAFISTKGATSISADNVFITGVSNNAPASIKNTTGNLSVSGGTINLLNFGQIQLTGGSGGLAINATVSDLRIANGSTISSASTGAVSCMVDLTLFIDGGVNGASSFTSANSATFTAPNIVLNGFSSNNSALISATQGNLSVTSDASLLMNPFATITTTGGSGTMSVMVGSDLLVANSSTISRGGTGALNINVVGSATLLGGAADALIKGATGALSLTVGGNLRLMSDLLGKASITSGGMLTVNATGDIVLLGALESLLQASIQTTSGALHVTAGNNLKMYDLGFIAATGGSGSVTVNVMNGDLYVENGSSIANQGTGGALNCIVTKNIIVKAGRAGSSSLAGNASVSCTAGGDLNLETSTGFSATISGKGLMNVVAERIIMDGFSNVNTANILNTTNNLTVTASSLNLLNFSNIRLSGGSGALQVNANAGDLRIANGSFVQNQSAGPLNATIGGRLYLTGGNSGAASILGGNGATTVAANSILMSGLTSVNNAVISSAQGTLTVTTASMGMLYMAPQSKIVLNAGSNNVNVSVGGTLYKADNTSISTLGTGMTNITAGATVICHP